MAYTYLDVTNEVLNRFNEVELTSSGFGNARGFQIQCKNAVNDAINYAVENYNFDNADSYEIDFSLDYDGRVQAETINLNETYDLVERIVRRVHNLFKEADAPEETKDA